MDQGNIYILDKQKDLIFFFVSRSVCNALKVAELPQALGKQFQVKNLL